jgi:hypothetical protein
MINKRPAEQRGHANHGWLDTYHTFSFAHYYDPEHMGFRKIRVINDDTVQPGQGFGTHGHRDMEIVSYVLEGALEHRDSMGTGSVLRAGDVQRMTAGTGVTHSEFNHSKDQSLRFLQIWILPEHDGLTPGYEEITVPDAEKTNTLRKIVSPEGDDGGLKIHQDVTLYAGRLDPGAKVAHDLKQGRHAWVQVANGSLALNGERLRRGDGAAVSDVRNLELEGIEKTEVLLFDLA